MKPAKLFVLVALVPVKMVWMLATTAVRLVADALINHSGESRPLPSAVQFKWPSLGDFAFEVVGESHYQRRLEEIVGAHGSHRAEMQCIAEVVCEDDNPHDSSAVAVFVLGQRVGYLGRQDARSYRRRLGAKRMSGQATTCDAMIFGGTTLPDGSKQSYGVFLDVKPFT